MGDSCGKVTGDFTTPLEIRHKIERMQVQVKQRTRGVGVMDDETLLEVIADEQTPIWAHWMRYLFSVCSQADDGSMFIPKEKVDRWQRQMWTPYTDLTDAEKIRPAPGIEGNARIEEHPFGIVSFHHTRRGSRKRTPRSAHRLRRDTQN